MSCSMFERLDREQLGFLKLRVQRLIGNVHALEQAKREERGAYVRSELSVPTYQFEQSLLRSYRNLFEEVIASLRGRNDDLAMGRLHQDSSSVPEVAIDEAMDYWDVPLDEKEQGIDKTKLAAILVLILLWRSRHTNRAIVYLKQFFEQGRTTALKEIGVETVLTGEMTNLRDSILARYTADLDRLETALREGSPRSRGIEWIVSNAATLGEALALLRRLKESESLRVRMFSESLSWGAFHNGYRAGAVEGTQILLKANGIFSFDVETLSNLSSSSLYGIPRYRWNGPQDTRTCSNCNNQFGEPVYAFSLSDLPEPESICSYGRACRHDWIFDGVA